MVQANYRFKEEGTDAEKKRREDEEQGRFNSIDELFVPESMYSNEELQLYYKLAYYKCYARELANQRDKSTTFFLDEAKRLFKDNAKVEIKSLVG